MKNKTIFSIFGFLFSHQQMKFSHNNSGFHLTVAADCQMSTRATSGGQITCHHLSFSIHCVLHTSACSSQSNTKFDKNIHFTVFFNVKVYFSKWED